MPNNDALTPEIVRELLNDCAVKKAEFDASLAAFHASQAQLRVSMSDEQYRLQRAMNSADSKLIAVAPALARAYLQQAEELERLRRALEGVKAVLDEVARLDAAQAKLSAEYSDLARRARAGEKGLQRPSPQVVDYGNVWSAITALRPRVRAALAPEGQP